MLSSSTLNDKQSNWNQVKSLRRFPENSSTSPTKSVGNKPVLPPKPSSVHLLSMNNNNNQENNSSHCNPQSTPPSSGSCHGNTPSIMEQKRQLNASNALSLIKSANERRMDIDLLVNNRETGGDIQTSPASLGGPGGHEDASFSHLISCVSPAQPRSVTRTSRTSQPSKTPSSPDAACEQAGGFFSGSNKPVLQPPRPQDLIDKGTYLVSVPNWCEHRGLDECKKLSKKVLEKNNNIWELVSKEYNYFVILVRLHEVYGKNYPFIEAGTGGGSSGASNLFESIESVLPGLEPLIECHFHVINCLVDSHLMRPDRVITDVGRVLNDAFTDDICNQFAELYGKLSFTSKYIHQKLNFFKKYPQFSSYLHKCERDPQLSKNKINDWLPQMSIHWTKFLITLKNLIENTINDSQEVDRLQQCHNKIHGIIKRASHILELMENRRTLQNLVESYDVTPDSSDSELVYQFLTADNATLLHMGEMQYEFKNISNKVGLKDIVGVALEKCVIFLTASNDSGKSAVRYQLYQDRKIPSVLEWGKLIGYFREAESKSNESCSFYLILERPSVYFVHFFVNRSSERAIWKKVMMDGFARWQSEVSQIKEAENEIDESLRKISQKWSNTVFGLNLMQELNQSVRVALENRTVGFRCVLEEELCRLANASGSTTTCPPGSAVSSTPTKTVSGTTLKDQSEATSPLPPVTDTYIPDLTSPEGIHDWLEMFMEWVYYLLELVNRLKFSLCSSGSNITRSASEIEARKRPSVQTVKKCETFTSRDNTSYGDKKSQQDPFDVSMQNQKPNHQQQPAQQQAQTQQHQQQRRISISGFTGLFRSSRGGNSSKTDENSSSERRSIRHHKSPFDIGSASHLNSRDTAERGGLDSSELAEVEMATTDDFSAAAEAGTSPLSRDVVTAFSEINCAAKNVTMELMRLNAEKVRLEAELKKAYDQSNVHRDFYRRCKKTPRAGEDTAGAAGEQGFPNSAGLTSPCSNGSNGSNMPFSPGVASDENGDMLCSISENMTSIDKKGYSDEQKMVEHRRQVENLRQMYEKFGEEKAKWKKEFESDKSKIENDKEKLFEKNLEIQKEKDALIEREKKYKAKCIQLQNQLDTYMTTYAGFDKFCKTGDEDSIPEYGSLPSKYVAAASEGDRQGFLHSLHHQQDQQQQAPHSRSHSDDISQKRVSSKLPAASNHMPPLASMETTTTVDVSKSTLDQANIPEQLRGSLINQKFGPPCGASSVTMRDRTTMKNVSSESNMLSEAVRSRSALSYHISSSSSSSTAAMGTPRARGTPGTERRDFSSSSQYSRTNAAFHSDQDRPDSTLFVPMRPESPTTPTPSSVAASPSSRLVSASPSTSSADRVSISGFRLPLDLADKTKIKKDKKSSHKKK